MPTKYDERAMALTSPAKSPVEVSSDTPRSYLVRSVFDAQRATGEAHEAFLRVAHQCAELLGKHLAFQFKLIETGKNGRDHGSESFDRTTDVSRAPDFPRIDPEPVWLDRSQCLEFAIGSIGAVMGPEFAEIDGFPTRVRLPDEPLMLVDRILSIEGHPRSPGTSTAGGLPRRSRSKRVKRTCCSALISALTSRRRVWLYTDFWTPP
jgi:hypothetical protein